MHNYKNDAHFEGNLGKDAQLKTTASGDVVHFTLAVNDRWTDNKGNVQESTDWFDVEVWGPLTKFAATLKKGTPVVIKAQVKPRTYTIKDVEHRTVTLKAHRVLKIDYEKPQGANQHSDANEDAG